MEKQAFVYILASKKNGTLYTGVTSNLDKRMHEHKDKSFSKSFTAKYFLESWFGFWLGKILLQQLNWKRKLKIAIENGKLH